MAAEQCTKGMRDVLIDHLDGVPRLYRSNDPTTGNVTRALIGRGWLRYDRARMRFHTVITDQGRRVLAKALADWADALVRVGALDVRQIRPTSRDSAETAPI